MSLKDGQWSESEPVASGNSERRFLLTALVTASGALHVAWVDQEQDSEGPSGPFRIAGRVFSKGPSSESRLLSDPGADLSFSAPVLVADSGEQVHVVWMDGREEHWTLTHSFIGTEDYVKVYFRGFGSPYESSASRVTSRGKYNVDFLRGVRDSRGRRAEIIYFKMRRNKWADHWTTWRQGLRITRLTEDGWTEPAPLVRRGTPGRQVEEIFAVRAMRDGSGDLWVAYGAFPREVELGSVFLSELRLLHQDRGGEAEILTLAKGIDSPHSGDSVRLAPLNNGQVAVLYQAEVLRWKERIQRWFHGFEGRDPLYLLFTDGKHCLASTEVAEHTVGDLFDLAITDDERIHVVWVEDDGPDAVMKHMWVKADQD
jgi:hypothetical protein